MPAKGTTKVSDEQRKQIAAGRVLGKTNKQLAAETGLAKSTIDRQVTDPRTRTLIQRLKERDEATLKRIWAKALKRIEKHVDDKDPDISRRAYIAFFRMLNAGDPPLARLEVTNDRGGDFTLEELLVVYRRSDGSGS